MSLEPGQVIDGKYRIAKMIGEGGMGAVYLGENVRINRKVAIKVLHASYTGNEEVMQRFEREAQAAGRIGNDHILEVLDIGQLPDGDHFIIMEFLDPGSQAMTRHMARRDRRYSDQGRRPARRRGKHGHGWRRARRWGHGPLHGPRDGGGGKDGCGRR